jgi:hypothetical protein
MVVYSIISPFDTEQNALERINKSFIILANSMDTGVELCITAGTLIPDSNTAIALKHKGEYLPAEEVDIEHCTLNNQWCYDLPGSHFNDYLEIMHCFHLDIRKRSEKKDKNHTINIINYAILNLLAVELGYGDISKWSDPDQVAERILQRYVKIASPRDTGSYFEKLKEGPFGQRTYKNCRTIAERGFYDRTAESKAEFMKYYIIHALDMPEAHAIGASHVFREFIKAKEEYFGRIG